MGLEDCLAVVQGGSSLGGKLEDKRVVSGITGKAKKKKKKSEKGNGEKTK
jgi:hypothetical protein